MLQLSIFEPDTEWSPPDVSILPSWENSSYVGIDIETHDQAISDGFGSGCKWKNSYIVGISFCLENYKPFYLPIRHFAGGNLDKDLVFAYLKDQAKKFKGELIGANLQYDLGYLLDEGVWFENVKFFRDIQIADPLIYELHDSYSLQSITKRYGLGGKDEGVLSSFAKMHKLDPKRDLWKMNSKFVGKYAEQDALLPMQIYEKQRVHIVKNELQEVFKLESRVLPVLIKMRDRGVRIDTDKLEYINKWSIEQEKNCLSEIHMRTGISLGLGDINKKPPLVKVLETIGIKVEKTPSGQPKIDKNTLKDINHPVAEALARAKKVNHLRTSFVKSIQDRLIEGRIHCTFNQLARENDTKDGIAGARWGRMSSEQPNLQQQPSRDDFASMWRSIYLPDEGLQWGSLDYSQQEPRMLVHFAALLRLPKAQEALDKYKSDPNMDNHQMMADMTGLPRKNAKDIFLGKCYGMGGAKFCKSVGLPTTFMTNEKGIVIEIAGEEGQEMLNQFDDRLPFVKGMAKKAQDAAARRGYIKTISGRRCHFPTELDGRFGWTHKALNRLIQGSSADQTKMAMVALEAAGYPLQLQVHDEVTASIPNREVGEAMADIMSNCANLTLPFKVDLEIGDSWGGVK
jgi:DNA polymerase I-like protein with 3'-5' exonuclease and polymerase domains